jgi:hypothetical protein
MGFAVALLNRADFETPEGLGGAILEALFGTEGRLGSPGNL